jgi:hypothetical protein
MRRWLVAGLLLAASFGAAACPLCLGAFRSSTADQLVEVRQAVLADPSADGRTFRVAAVVKGERPANGVIAAAAVDRRADPAGAAKGTLLFVRDAGWSMWQAVGAASVENASWLRKIAAGKRSTDMSPEDWQARVALMLPYLESHEPLVAQVAYGELAAAPYTSLLAMKSRISAAAVRKWLADPSLAQRESMYLLLLGVAGDARDAAAIERRLDAAHAASDATSLGSLIAADLQLRGPGRLAWVEENYLLDRRRSSAEIDAALLALSVQGNASAAIPRERVIATYRKFMSARPDIAGYVARDLAAWQYWDAVPEYIALLKSNTPQQYPSKIAIVAYLRQSPNAGALDLSTAAVSPH